MAEGFDVDAIVVGAGFGGLYALHSLRELGLSVRAYEAGDGVGGTWYWNRYPGARCDTQSVEYSYSFSEELQQEWDWTERFATQPEILSYLDHVADRFDLRRDIRLSTRVTSAVYDEQASGWTVGTDRGEQLTARYVVMASGSLSLRQVPSFAGLESFRGETYHTGAWPHEPVDFAGKRVAVIGTGSSGIQVIPMIARDAEQLTVFQRTPNFTMPARNRPLEPEFVRELKADYREFRLRALETPAGIIVDTPTESALAVAPDERERRYDERWQRGGGAPQFLTAFTDVTTDLEANKTAADFVRDKIRSIVSDPEVAEVLAPDYPIGAKRVPVGDDYFATFNRENVALVDVKRTPIERITPAGVRTSEREVEVDAIVFATGYDAITGPLLAIDIRGRGGLPLKQKWEAGPRTYLGIQTAGFPNFFVIAGAGSPSVLANVVVSIEQHVQWLAGLLAYMRERGFDSVEATQEPEDAWVEHVNELAAKTMYVHGNSWYLGANIPGKPRVFMPYVGGIPAYRKVCATVAANDYEGFAFGDAGDRSPGHEPHAVREWSSDDVPTPDEPVAAPYD